MTVHFALSALIARTAEAADIDPDWISYSRVLRITRRTDRHGGFPPEDWATAAGPMLADITRKLNRPRRERSCPRAVKCARHNNYRVKKCDEPASTRHAEPATITLRHHHTPPTQAPADRPPR